MATLTLTPKYITDKSNFTAVLNGGEDYRTFAIAGVTVGTIAFDTSPLHNRSAACRLSTYSVSYQQKTNRDSIPKMYWNLSPRKIKATISGSSIGVITSSSSFGRYQQTNTNGNDYVNMSGVSFIDSDNLSSFDRSNLFGGDNLLAFYLSGSSDRTFDSRLYMKGLSATVTYEQRYYARFWDENGNLLGTAQDLAAGVMATAPTTDNQGNTLARDGYTIAWECDQVHGEYNNIYTAGHLPTSTETDLDFHILYRPINRMIVIKDVAKGSFYLYKYVNNDWQLQTESQYQYGAHYYTVQHGDHIKIVADGVTTTAEDLVVRLGDIVDDEISTTTVNGASSTTLDAFETQSITRHYIVTLTAQTHYFTVTTSVINNIGGTITPSRRVKRTGSTTISVTPTAGYKIKAVKVDNVAQTISNNQSWSKTFSNMQADHSVEAEFERIQYSITFDLPSGVSVTANGNAVSGNAQTVNHGDTVEFAFSCGDNMSLTGLFLDSSTDSLIAPVFRQVQNVTYTMFYIAGAHTLKATATSDLVTVTIGENTGNGTVTSDDLTNGTGKFVRSGGTLHFEAEEDYAWRFLQWFDEDDTGTTKNVTITAQYPENSTLTVYAEFEHPDNAVDVDIIGNGTVEKSRDAAYDDESVTFRAVAEEGWTFKKWDWTTGSQESQGSGPSQSPPRTPRKTDNPVTLLWGNVTDHVIHCYFQRTAHDVTLTKNGEPNTVAISEVENPEPFYTNEDLSDPSDGGGDYWFGATLHLTATPGTGWHFVRWSDGGGEGKNTRSIVIGTADIELQAVFAKDTFEQHFKAGEGGSVTIDGESATDVTVEYGDDLLLTFTAELGQKIKDVLVDGVSVFEDVTLTRRGGTYLLASIDAAHTVAVVFAPRIYTNGRRLLDYYPPVIASIVDIQRLMAAYQVSIDALWDAVSFLHENQYIETATDEGVNLWERELGIIPAATDTLNQRKARLRLKWVPSNNFTTKWLHGWLEDVCGATVPWPEVEGYTLKVTLPWFASWWSIFNDLRVYKPANIVLDPCVETPQASGKLYAGFAMQTEYQITIPKESFEIPTESEESP